MADDAEWIDVDSEFGPVRPAKTTTVRPWRRPTPRRPVTYQPPPFATTVWPPRYPHTTTPHTPHDAAERASPAGPTSPQHASGANAIIFGVLGGVMMVLIVGLLLYMLVLRKKLVKAETSKRRDDYSIRIEDVANLATPLDDSSQLYANTTDLHKLVSSVKATRKNPPLNPVELRNRPMCPVPTGSAPSPSRTDKGGKFGHSKSTGFKRLYETFGTIRTNLQNKLFRNNEAQANPGFESSMPDIVQIGVPEVLDDDDIWSEDSFDSCSVGYENETDSSFSRVVSQKRSLRHKEHNDSKRSKGNNSRTKIGPPKVAPPLPPLSNSNSLASDTIDITGNIYDTVAKQALTPTNSSNFAVVRKAPPPPIVGKNPSVSNNLASVNKASIIHTTIQVPQQISQGNKNEIYNQHKAQSEISSSHTNKTNTSKPNLPALPTSLKPVKSETKPEFPLPSIHSKQNNHSSVKESYPIPLKPITIVNKMNPPAIPFLPKPINTTENVKPSPPAPPKPSAKPQKLPKLKMGLQVPPKGATLNQNTPDTTITLLSGTPSRENNIFRLPSNIKKTHNNVHKLDNQKSNSSANEVEETVDPSSLTVSERRALMEGKSALFRK